MDDENASQSKSMFSSDEFNTPGSKGALSPELFTGDSLLELCNSFWKPSPSAQRNVQPYLRGCKWSPDGTCCLSVVNHDGMHVMELPRDLYEGCPARGRMITLLPATIHVKEGGLVYDFCWYPKMNSFIPESCSWITTKKNSPIQMWDAYNGSLRCSYRGFDSMDEMEPALSVTFTHQGDRIVGGYKNCLRTFDVERPGRDFVEHKINSPASCFATSDKLLAVGSWNTNIKLFSISDMSSYKSLGNMHGHSGGVTHIQFTPDKTKLVSGARKDHNILVWDIRYHNKPLNVLKRCVTTNQRIYFDISACGRYLVSGGSDGVIRVWDEKYIKWTEKYNIEDPIDETAIFRFRLHQDSCNSISIHPSRPILATGSGQFHFVDPVKTLEQESDSSDDDENQRAMLMASQLESNYSPLTNEKTKSHNARIPSNEICKEGNNEESSRKGHKVHLTNEIKDKVHKHDTSEISQREVDKMDLCPEVLIELPQQNGSEKVEDEKLIVDAAKVSIVMPEKDIPEEPPPKRLALDTTTNSSIAVCKMDIREEYTDGKLIIGSKTILKLNADAHVSTQINKSRLDATDQTCPDQMYIDEEALPEEAKLNIINKPPTEVPKIDTAIRYDKDVTHTDVKHLYELDEVSMPQSQVPTHADMKVSTKPAQIDVVDSLVDTSDLVTTKARYKSNLPRKASYSSTGSNESEMIYSSYSENNLAFWWLAKITEVQVDLIKV